MPDKLSTKEIQRKAGISARKSIPRDEAQRLSMEICNKLRAHTIYKKSDVILAYCPFGGEVDVNIFNEYARQDGKSLALPICHEGGRMIAAIPNDSDSWEVGKHGITAPVEERSRILSPLEIQLVIVPCTAFDGVTRMRVGMGAGYYDRYLPQCTNATKIAVAYESQHIKGVCTNEWDIPLDYIATEINWY